ncbi:lysozyme [Sphingomonas sp. H39-1-10]|uniref:lysozyme n=1 Tax=Sphingomonas pollutisoli TaxID=3030829 RepID=UPI0023B8E0DD|nr:lysozyme [Sphingomonas pollutisoli]MDF0489220.1 lysozyme [Sphingomonas pollutisoli]
MAANTTPAFARAIAGALSAVAVATLAIATPALEQDEGKANVGYLDIAKIPTECFGHTGPEVRVGVRRSDAYCHAKLAGDAETHLRGVLACTPTLADRRYQLAAATRTAFNIGVAAFCKSTIARKFNARDWRGGCDAMLAWNKARVNGRLVVVAGLAKRRERERAMCLTGI